MTPPKMTTASKAAVTSKVPATKISMSTTIATMTAIDIAAAKMASATTETTIGSAMTAAKSATAAATHPATAFALLRLASKGLARDRRINQRCGRRRPAANINGCGLDMGGGKHQGRGRQCHDFNFLHNNSPARYDSGWGNMVNIVNHEVKMR